MDDTKRLELIAEAVRYCHRAKALGMPVSCYTKALREPIFFLWEARNGSKIKIARFRSRASIGLKYGKGEIVMDHAVPFRYLQAELLSLNPITPAVLAEKLNRLGTTVIITKAENALLNAKGYGHEMPDGWDKTDILARYKAAGIELVENSAGTEPGAVATGS